MWSASEIVTDMDIESFRNICMQKKGVTEEFPFGEDTLVFKVMGKMFALTSLSAEDFRVNLKCDPERAVELRDEYESVIPGYHMNKTHWNTVYFEGGELSNEELFELINHSYELIVASLPKKTRMQLNDL